MSPKVTILVPNYKTLELTKLCLRLIRQKTPKDLYKVIVIDNDSQDASVEYLRNVKWIELIERKTIPGEPVHLAHARALDLALQRVDTPYVLSIHTDSIVLQEDWLNYLLENIEANPNIAGVGPHKIEERSILTHIGKFFERPMQRFWYSVTKKQNHALENMGDNHYYLRSHCAMYRMDLIRKYGLSFGMENKTAGKAMHKNLVDLGFDMLFLPHNILNKKIEHIYHATMILHPELGARRKTIRRGVKKIQARLNAANAQQVLADDSLDH